MTNSNSEIGNGKKNYMSNSYNEKSNFKARYSSKKDNGGFRIRLSDNEMKSVKKIQETFQLKSTVAVLGFAVRTLSELINDNDIRGLIEKYGQRNQTSFNKVKSGEKKMMKDKLVPDPFARPAKSEPLEKDQLKFNNGDEN